MKKFAKKNPTKNSRPEQNSVVFWFRIPAENRVYPLASRQIPDAIENPT